MKLLSTKNLIAFMSFLFLILFFSLMIAGSLSEKTPKINLGVNSVLGEVDISAPEGTNFSLENLDGKNVNLSDYQGSPLVIDFWSSWCGPCIKEASILSEAEKEWSFRGIKFIGIAVWDESDQIKEFILNNNKNIDFCLCEIGGTVGDIEGLPFFEAIRQLGNELPDNKTCFVHLTLVPYIAAAGEIKTKPTQHSVKELRSIGIQPDVLLCRSEKRIDKSDIKKIAVFCNVSEKSVIQATDVKTIYEIPKIYSQNGFDTEVLASMSIKKPKKINLRKWNKVVHSVNNPRGQVNIGVIGKYVGLKDAYKSLSEALTHGGIANDISVKIHWIDSEKIKTKKDTKLLKSMSGILIPGGFGKRGSEGKILAINYARTNKIPFFGICFGMQLAVIEAARNLAKIDNANSSELSNTKNPVIGLMTEWEKNDKKFLRDSNSEYGGTMRLGSYPAILNKKSLSYKIYKTKKINERHRHRYEVNINYKEKLEQIGLNFAGISPDGLLPEIVEIKNHPWFVGVQFHPELKSRPFDPHPLFSSFIKASIKESINKK